MTFANNTTKLDIMKALKELFFPNGKLKMGEMKNFTYETGNYQIETIPDIQTCWLHQRTSFVKGEIIDNDKKNSKFVVVRVV